MDLDLQESIPFGYLRWFVPWGLARVQHPSGTSAGTFPGWYPPHPGRWLEI